MNDVLALFGVLLILVILWDAAELMESHLSYPVLCYFRSQHDNQSWLAALSEFLVMPLPPWILSEATIDNWKMSAWGRIQ